jgi:aspartyl-tRNA(Asn)/glutamyl-tRNA(Gln) amidotransferase subunit A
MTGVVGLKPTWGRVSRYGLTAYASSLEQPGPFGRCVQDVAMLLEVLAAPDIHDATCQLVPGGGYLENLEAGVAGLRVGLPREYLELDAAPPVREALQGAIEALKAAGAVVVDVSMPHTRFGIAAYYVLATAEAASNLSRYDGVRYGQRAAGSSLREVYVHSRTEGLGEEVQRRILLGTFVLSAGYYDAYYRKAQQARARIRADFAAAFADCDVLLTPTAPTPAFRLGEKAEPLELYLSDVYTVGANLAGVPAVSVPAGFSAEGLPVGVQLLAPWLEEARLLRAARALEAHRLATDGEAALRRPPLTGFDT